MPCGAAKKKKSQGAGAHKERSKSQRKGTPGCLPHPPPLVFVLSAFRHKCFSIPFSALSTQRMQQRKTCQT